VSFITNPPTKHSWQIIEFLKHVDQGSVPSHVYRKHFVKRQSSLWWSLSQKISLELLAKRCPCGAHTNNFTLPINQVLKIVF